MTTCKICNAELKSDFRIYCSNKCKFSDVDYNKSRVSPVKNNILENIKCKICGWESSDVLNKSGAVTAHLHSHNIEFKRASYIELFDILKLEEPIYLQCPICDWKSIDVKNKSGVFTRHIQTHNITLDDFILKYPIFDNLWATHKEKKKLEDFIKFDLKHQIKCEICGKLFKKLSNSHLASHNLTPTEYKMKYNVSSTVSDYTSDLQSSITTKYNLEHGSSFSTNDRSSLEQDFIDKLIINNIHYISPFIYDGKKFDIYIPTINFVIEIDGETYHKNELKLLTLQTIHGSYNDESKNKIMNASNFKFYRIRYDKSKFNFNSIEELIRMIEISKYTPSYNIEYKQTIATKEYFKTFLQYKPQSKLKEYSHHLLKFIRTFQPELPYPDLEENLPDVMKKLSNMDASKPYNPETREFSNNISVVGHNYLKHHFHSYWGSRFNGNPSPKEAWLDDKIMQEVIDYRIGCNNSGEVYDFSLHQCVRGLSARRISVSFFKPALAASIYKTYLKDTVNPIVLDPCCGFGGRLLGFKSLYPDGIYVGCEPNIETYNELLNLVTDGKWGETVKIYNCKFEDFVVNNNCKFDMVFTSIPYYDVEIYSNNVEYKSFEEWKNIFIKSIENCILYSSNVYINLPLDLSNKLGWNDKVTYHIKSNKSHFDKTEGNKLEPIIKLS
jgi:hypothetical protein